MIAPLAQCSAPLRPVPLAAAMLAALVFAGGSLFAQSRPALPSPSALKKMSVEELMRPGDSGKWRFRMRTDRIPFPQRHERRRNVVISNKIELLTVPQIHSAEIRAADTGCVLKHLPEYRLQFARR